MLYLGIMFGKNVVVVDKYLKTYSNIVVAISVAVIVFFVVRYFINKKKK